MGDKASKGCMQEACMDLKCSVLSASRLNDGSETSTSSLPPCGSPPNPLLLALSRLPRRPLHLQVMLSAGCTSSGASSFSASSASSRRGSGCAGGGPQAATPHCAVPGSRGQQLGPIPLSEAAAGVPLFLQTLWTKACQSKDVAQPGIMTHGKLRCKTYPAMSNAFPLALWLSLLLLPSVIVSAGANACRGMSPADLVAACSMLAKLALTPVASCMLVILQ